MLASSLQYPAAEAVHTVDVVQPYAAGVFISKPRNMGRTVSYAAPEMTKGYCGEFLGQLCAMGCDMWAIGCVALLLNTGNNPFAVKDDNDDKDRSSLALHNKWVIPSGRFMVAEKFSASARQLRTAAALYTFSCTCLHLCVALCKVMMRIGQVQA